MQDSVDAVSCDVQDLTAELQKARKTIARQRGQLTGLSESLLRERAENAKLRDHIFKLELEMDRDETEEERRHDDAAGELEECVALMALNPRGAAATRADVAAATAAELPGVDGDADAVQRLPLTPHRARVSISRCCATESALPHLDPCNFGRGLMMGPMWAAYMGCPYTTTTTTV